MNSQIIAEVNLALDSLKMVHSKKRQFPLVIIYKVMNKGNDALNANFPAMKTMPKGGGSAL